MSGADSDVDEPVIIRFEPDDSDAVLTAMRSVAANRDGWINFQPVLHDDTGGSPADMPPVRAGVLGLFTGRGPAVPVCTWVPGQRRRRGTEPDSIGIQHGAGPKAAGRLRGAGITAPDGWRVLADHAKRGLVVQLPDGTDPAVVLDWLLRAASELSTVTLTGSWAAVIHHR